MKKYTKIRFKLFITITTLSFIVFISQYTKIYSQDISTSFNVDDLIENKKYQSELNEEILNSQSFIDKNKKNKNQNLVKISFVDNIENTSSNQEDEKLEILMSYKKELEHKLEQAKIEQLDIEENLKKNTKTYLKENNQKYIKGIWPTKEHTYISSEFGNRVHPITGKYSFHRGVDIPAPKDTDILAFSDGKVIFSGTQNGYGNIIKIQHFDDTISVYAHNNSNDVKEGDIVKAGQVIGKVGTTGNSTGNHIHFETIANDEYINPVESIIK